MGALGWVEVERRVLPPLLLEDRAEDEWLPCDLDARGMRELLDATRRDVRVRARKLEPELQRGDH
jgi:hypothetical protein